MKAHHQHEAATPRGQQAHNLKLLLLLSLFCLALMSLLAALQMEHRFQRQSQSGDL